MSQGKGHAQLGDYTFRLDPDQIHYDYKINYSVIDTLGGQVIQVLGSTIGDITITGSFGQDHANQLESWELAESFHTAIKAMMDQQTRAAKGIGHTPIRFTYHDGIHNWDFSVLIKGISDTDGEGALEHSTGKFSYHYTLTLFLVSENSVGLRRITTDQFITRVSSGLGWKRSKFNGSNTLANAIKFIQNNSQDGKVDGYLLNILQGTPPVTSTPRNRTTGATTAEENTSGSGG